ncbi:MAG TPA: BrnA antitoxin family protein [Vicinamibacterales bacterium]|nr:BrnA antitoxin family protein [Vicinamibacterales bacterium]
MPKLKPGTIIPGAREDAAITRAARRDPDAKPLTDAEWKAAKPHARIGRPPKPDAKIAVKLRLDPDLLAVLKATGPGWQTRANRILRERFAM